MSREKLLSVVSELGVYQHGTIQKSGEFLEIVEALAGKAEKHADVAEKVDALQRRYDALSSDVGVLEVRKEALVRSVNELKAGVNKL